MSGRAGPHLRSLVETAISTTRPRRYSCPVLAEPPSSKFSTKYLCFEQNDLMMLVRIVISLQSARSGRLASAYNSQGTCLPINYVHAVQVEENQLWIEAKA